MSNQLVGVLISLVIGAAGGYVVGAWFKKVSLGVAWNVIVGVIGGGIAGPLLHAGLGTSGGTGILSYVAGSAVGSVVLVALVGLFFKPPEEAR